MARSRCACNARRPFRLSNALLGLTQGLSEHDEHVLLPLITLASHLFPEIEVLLGQRDLPSEIFPAAQPFRARAHFVLISGSGDGAGARIAMTAECVRVD